VKVYCRIRPENESEQRRGGAETCIAFDDDNTVVVSDPTSGAGSQSAYRFTFDEVFRQGSTQEELYTTVSSSIMESVLKGYNGTIFAYGQTGSGKTFTMEGPSLDSGSSLRGMIPRVIDTLFEGIGAADACIEFTVKVSVVEIYNERIRDLLDTNKDRLEIKEDRNGGVAIEGATEVYVASPQDIFASLQLATSNRATAATKMNEYSSRSHSIFILTVVQRHSETLSVKTGRLHMVDLAGSEKVKKTEAEGKVRLVPREKGRGSLWSFRVGA